MSDEVRIPVASDADMVVARQKGRELAGELGFSRTDATFIATAISEVGRNIIAYADRGEIVLTVLREKERQGIQVVARDCGPGIPDIDRAMQEGYATGPGLGLGLPGARRLMDEFAIESIAGKGTTITMQKWRDYTQLERLRRA